MTNTVAFVTKFFLVATKSFNGVTTLRLFFPLCKIRLEVLIEKGSAAVSCDANRTKTVCRTVEHMNFFLKVSNIEL